MRLLSALFRTSVATPSRCCAVTSNRRCSSNSSNEDELKKSKKKFSANKQAVDKPVVSKRLPDADQLGDFYFGGEWKCGRLPYDESRVGRTPKETVGRDMHKFFHEEISRINTMADRHWDAVKLPTQSEIIIIGGGIMGSSLAFWLRLFNLGGPNVTIIEKDLDYSRSATTLSVGGIRQQFSLYENIQLSQFTADFLRNINEHLGVIGCDPPDIGFQPMGYLFLATQDGYDTLKSNNELQTGLGAKVRLMNPDDIKKKWPWLNLDGIQLGNFGIENEGWLDPWSLLSAFRLKNESMQVRYVKGELVDVAFDVQSKGGFPKPTFAYFFSVQPRKRYVYVLHCPSGPGLDMPLVVDPSGFYIRREGLGNHYLCGMSPANSEEEPPNDDLEVDFEWFYERIWPKLAHRIPAFEELKVKTAWAGYYDYNYFDENLIVGPHPFFSNFWFCNGLSGHGLQHAPAVGRSVAELYFHDSYKTIPLDRFHFDRVFANRPLYERNIV